MVHTIVNAPLIKPDIVPVNSTVLALPVHTPLVQPVPVGLSSPVTSILVKFPSVVVNDPGPRIVFPLGIMLPAVTVTPSFVKLLLPIGGKSF